MSEEEAPVIVPETVVETLTRVLDTVTNTKEWGKAKADTVASRITAAGGEPSAEVAELLSQIAAAVA